MLLPQRLPLSLPHHIPSQPIYLSVNLVPPSRPKSFHSQHGKTDALAKHVSTAGTGEIIQNIKQPIRKGKHFVVFYPRKSLNAHGVSEIAENEEDLKTEAHCECDVILYAIHIFICIIITL